MVAILCFVFLITLIVGAPIAIVIGVSSLAVVLVQGIIPLNAIPQYMFGGLDSFSLLAIPFFILAGELMGQSGISKKLINFCMALVGKIPGALAHVNIIASIFFSGITGAAVADTAALGALLIPSMVDEGYTPEYSAAITAISSCIDPIIPPSIIVVVYGIAANVSIGKLLIAGYIPGLLLALSQGILASIQAKKYHFPVNEEPFSWPKLGEAFIEALPALVMPLIIIGGILGGVVTPTEAASVAVLYSFIYGFANKSIRLKDLSGIFSRAGVTVGVVMLVMSTAKLFSMILVMNNIPDMITNAFLSVSNNKYIVLFMINILLLIVGCFMEISAACIILAPILVPVVVKLGVDPVQFGMIMCVNLAIGLATPPVGPTLYVACRIAKISLEQITKAILPYIIASVCALLVITYIPQVSLFLPNLLIK